MQIQAERYLSLDLMRDLVMEFITTACISLYTVARLYSTPSLILMTFAL